ASPCLCNFFKMSSFFGSTVHNCEEDELRRRLRLKDEENARQKEETLSLARTMHLTIGEKNEKIKELEKKLTVNEEEKMKTQRREAESDPEIVFKTFLNIMMLFMAFFIVYLTMSVPNYSPISNNKNLTEGKNASLMSEYLETHPRNTIKATFRHISDLNETFRSSQYVQIENAYWRINIVAEEKDQKKYLNVNLQRDDSIENGSRPTFVVYFKICILPHNPSKPIYCSDWRNVIYYISGQGWGHNLISFYDLLDDSSEFVKDDLANIAVDFVVSPLN
ncbi:hypothetical protein PFISCL1PPCAC_24723, partial [Pristionchus fissidentatus]